MSIIKTERLLLRPLNETNAAEMFKIGLGMSVLLAIAVGIRIKVLKKRNNC